MPRERRAPKISEEAFIEAITQAVVAAFDPPVLSGVYVDEGRARCIALRALDLYIDLSERQSTQADGRRS